MVKVFRHRKNPFSFPVCIIHKKKLSKFKSHFRNLKLKNLKYLTVQQTLADAANFIRQMNRNHGITKKQKWIVFGGSYGGALAVWLKVKYPEMVFGVVSSSGPINPVINFESKKYIVNYNMHLTHPFDSLRMHYRLFEFGYKHLKKSK